jgi:hypothetical protein
VGPLIRILILFGLVFLLHLTRKPLLCAVVYLALYGVVGLLLGSTIQPILVKGPIFAVLAFLYFTLLMRLNRESPWWFFVLAVGLAIGLK